ncbi:hypothetical protein AAEH72_16055 [Shewanella xiamenensis]|uniref:hypothetical protein n=2 Tax=Shewanellaceae TaxID=267890 RepID=UPI00313A983B
MAKCLCPDCGGKLKIWFNMNASIEFDISATGSITKPNAISDENGEGRAGIKCSSCDWGIHLSDSGSDKWSDVFERAGEKVSEFELVAKRIKSN